MDIQKFIERFKHTFVYELLSKTITDEQLFEHVIDKDGAPIWFKDQTRQMWFMWQAAKAQAVPEGFVLVPKVKSGNFSEKLDDYLDDLWKSSCGFDDGFVSVSEINHDKIWSLVTEAQEQSHEQVN